MKNLFLYAQLSALALFFFTSCVTKRKVVQDDGFRTVTFKVSTQKTKADAVFLAGNQQSIGNWQPNGLALEKINDTLWQSSIRLQRNTTLSYKVTRGTWDTEAVAADGKVLDNTLATIYGDTVLSYTVKAWKDNLPKPIIGQVTGSLITIKDWKIDRLKSRNVHIWLPPNYEESPNARYPVLYILDGQNVFDPKTAAFGRDWGLDEMVDSLIRTNQIEPIIMVAINNSADRSEEYGYGEIAKSYQNWMSKTLKPYIDENYRTRKDAKNTAIMGASMGGLFAFEMAWDYPGIYGRAAAMSPAFHIDNIDYVKEVARGGILRSIDIYIDNGTLDLEAKLQPGIDEMLLELKKQNYPFTFFKDEGATHNEIAWGKRAWRPLLQFFKKQEEQPILYTPNPRGIPMR